MAEAQPGPPIRPYHDPMPDATASPTTRAIAFEAFGVPIGFSTNDERVEARLREFMPPGSRPCDPAAPEQRFALTTAAAGTGFELRLNDEWTVHYDDLEIALGLLDTHLTGFIAVNARERIFVHAGVVSHHGRLLVMPGMSFAGKSTLVAALLRAGATYYSDDFALLDERGLVHPYPKPLSLRGKHQKQTTHTAESLGGRVGEEPLPPAMIAMTTYRRGAEWRPRRLSSGESVLAMLSNTVPARERPEESMRAISRAVEGAVVVESERGEAEEIAPLLLAELDR